jgi:hypothetical protein
VRARRRHPARRHVRPARRLSARRRAADAARARRLPRRHGGESGVPRRARARLGARCRRVGVADRVRRRRRRAAAQASAVP